MTESLHTHLVSTLRTAGINPALSEDEIDDYPYVTFELPVEYRYTKDGPYKIVGNLTIRSVSESFEEADTLRASIESAIAEGFGGPHPVSDEEAVDPGEEAIEEEVMPADSEDQDEPATEEPDPEDPIDPGEPEPDEQEDAQEDDTPTYIYTARLTDVRKDCMDGVWVIELDYILNQYE